MFNCLLRHHQACAALLARTDCLDMMSRQLHLSLAVDESLEDQASCDYQKMKEDVAALQGELEAGVRSISETLEAHWTQTPLGTPR